MEKKYIFPEMEILRFAEAEVITASNLLEEELGADGKIFDFETGLPE